MPNPFILEICVDSLVSAMAAERGGADRIELCANLETGGTTPGLALIELTRKQVALDINVLIRPRSGDFCYSAPEYEVMKREIELVRDLGVQGIVTGILTPDGEIDLRRMEELIRMARPLTVTFHRAFDMTRHPFAALDALIGLGVERILTSGQEPAASEGTGLLARLVQQAQGRTVIMPGAGITAQNVGEIIRQTGAGEVHMSLKEKVKSPMRYRNQRVAMGGQGGRSEYELFFTNEDAVRHVRTILNEQGNNIRSGR